MNDTKRIKNSKKFSEPEDKSEEAFERDLKVACKDLTFISETDADVIPFTAKKPSAHSLGSYLAALDVVSKEIEERSLDNFFDRLTSKKDWHGPREKERTKGWSTLRNLLEKYLDQPRVIRVGRIHLDIYIVGIDAAGRLAGVKTKAIET